MGRGERGKEPPRSVSCCPQTGGAGTARDGAAPCSHLRAGSPGLGREKGHRGQRGHPAAQPALGSRCCSAPPDSAHPWPSIHFPLNEKTGPALLKGCWSSLGLLRNCAEKQGPVAPRAVSWVEKSQIPLANTQRQLREQGCVPPGGELPAPCALLCAWKVLLCWERWNGKGLWI